MSRASTSNAYNICLICGSHTDLVLNIFEKRCGPNIVDIIFAKFKFKAEKNSADKFICYDCNNWLINWFSLQNINETSEKVTRGSTEPSSGIKNPTDEDIYPEINNPIVEKTSQVPDFKNEKGVYINSCREIPRYKNHHRRIVKLAKKRLIQRSTFITFLSGQTLPTETPKVENNTDILIHNKSLSHKKGIDYTHVLNENRERISQPKPHIFDDKILSMLHKQGTDIITENDNSSRSLKPKICADEIIININSVQSEIVPLLSTSSKNDENILHEISKKIPKSLSISLSNKPKDYFWTPKNDDLVSIIID